MTLMKFVGIVILSLCINAFIEQWCEEHNPQHMESEK